MAKKKYKRKTKDVWMKSFDFIIKEKSGKKKKATLLGFFRTERAANRDDALMWGDNKKNSKVKKVRKPLDWNLFDR